MRRANLKSPLPRPCDPGEDTGMSTLLPDLWRAPLTGDSRKRPRDPAPKARRPHLPETGLYCRISRWPRVHRPPSWRTATHRPGALMSRGRRLP